MYSKKNNFEKNSINSDRKKMLISFCKKMNLRFKDLSLLDLAFHHRSYSNENVLYKNCNNERLEFLGDSVLGLVTASFLYNDMFNNPEGDLAKIKSNVVSELTLSTVAKEQLEISSLLVLGKGEELSGGRHKNAILADAVEAIIGAIYLDLGYLEAQKFVLSFIVPEIRKVQENKGNKDFKSILQEYYQKKVKKSPCYELISCTGPAHEKVFTVRVVLGKESFSPAEGKNKKSAEQNAAKIACQKLGLI